MAGALSRLEHAHARLVEQIAGETVRIAVAGPGLEAEERRAGPRPQRRVLKALIFHRDRRPRGVDEGERPALAIEEAERVVFEQRVGQRQIAAAKRDRTCRPADKAARREFRNLGPLGPFELNQRALAPRLAERPAETGVQPASVRRAPFAGIGDFDRDCERIGAQPIFDRKCKGERIDRARA